MIGITILGSTGSIGVSTLDVIARHPEKFKVIALSAQKSVDLLREQCIRYRPQYVVVQQHAAAKILREQLQLLCPEIQVLEGSKALEEISALPEVDYVMAAIVGAAGLLPTLAAARAGKRILLANKEALVMAGNLFMQAVQQHKAVLLPIDSEHNALFQCMPAQFQMGQQPAGVEKIIITASGGAFRNTPLTELDRVTPEQACSHPNWSMGQKITVDSATMLNKGLEVIEAHWLFNLPAERIETILHPQSIIHSLVVYKDGSLLAQLGNPDMRTPIAQALAWPDRIASGVEALDLLVQNRLDFVPMDQERYPCLKLAYQALAATGTAAAILNAANEVAVQAFLQGQIAFTDIFSVNEKTVASLAARKADSLEIILEDDRRARECAKGFIRSMVSKSLMI